MPDAEHHEVGDDSAGDGRGHDLDGSDAVHEQPGGQAHGYHADGRYRVEQPGVLVSQGRAVQPHEEDPEAEGGAEHQHGQGARERPGLQDAVQDAGLLLALRFVSRLVRPVLRALSPQLVEQAVLGILGKAAGVVLVAAEQREHEGERRHGRKAQVEVLRRFGVDEEQRQGRPDGHGERLSQAVVADALAEARQGEHVGGCGRGCRSGGGKPDSLQDAADGERGRSGDEHGQRGSDEQQDGAREHDSHASHVVDDESGDQARYGGRR